MGYADLPKMQRKLLIEAILQRECYLSGYKKAPSQHTFIKWWLKYNNAKSSSVSIESVFDSQVGKNRKAKFVTYLDREYPQHLHKLYRYATSILGVDAGVPLIIGLMNAKSNLDFPFCPIRSNLGFSKYHFWVFFNKYGGKLRSPTTKPTLTAKQKKLRLNFVTDVTQKLQNHKKSPTRYPYYYCFLDEKWMYTTSRRKKLKILPPADFEDPEEVAIKQPKTRNRRFPCKVMYMGVVAPPSIKHYFDGKILLKRISREKVQKIDSFHQRFTNSYITNTLIREGQWRSLVPNDEDIQIGRLKNLIQDAYQIDNDIKSRLVFSYSSFPIRSTTGKSAKIRIKDGDDQLLVGEKKVKDEPASNPRPLTVTDIDAYVLVPKNTAIQEDISCDSEFMLGAIDEIGTAIRSKFFWVDKKTSITLFMDNAGGHGTDEAKEQYVSKLAEKYNVLVHWQVPNSPETNMLDLGIWMSLQSLIEKIHKQSLLKSEYLDKSVQKAWHAFGGFTTFMEVAERWRKVLDLIIEDNGGNDKVESCRGLKAALRKTPSKELFRLFREYDDEGSCSDMSISDDDVDSE